MLIVAMNEYPSNIRITEINTPRTIIELGKFVRSGHHDILAQWAAMSLLEAKPGQIHDAYVQIGKLTQDVQSHTITVKPYKRYRILRDMVEKAIQYCSSTKNDRTCLLHHVLNTGMGNCLSLCIVYAIVSRKLSMDSNVILSPNHTFITFHINNREYACEPTTGSILPMSLKMRTIYPSDTDTQKCPSFFRPLTDLELFSVLLTKYTAFLVNRKRLRQAYQAAKLAVDIFPTNPDAHFNLAVLAAAFDYQNVTAKEIIKTAKLHLPSITASLTRR